MGTTATLTSTLLSRRLATPTEEFLEDTLMWTPMENFNRFSTLLMEQDSVLLTLVSPLLPSTMALLPPSTQSLLLPQLSTQSFQLPQRTPPRLPRLRLLISLLLPLPLLLLRGRGVRLDLLTDSELTTPLRLFMGMLAFLMLMASPTTDKLRT